jgi:thiamine-monophosphate kinase
MPARPNHRRTARTRVPRRSRRIGEIDEFDLIDRLTARLPEPHRLPPFGPGDDAALVPTDPETLVTTDTLVDGVHFRRDWSTPAEVGFRALEVNLSDIAAMGGRPSWAVVSLVLPESMRVGALEEFYRGLAKSARRAEVGVVGGNMTRGAQFSASITVLGRTLGRGHAVARSGASPGDWLFVTGQPGLAAAGRKLLEASGRGADLWEIQDPAGESKRAAGTADMPLADPAAKAALQRYLVPDARVALGLEITRAGASAMIDVSDGLAADLHHLARASGCGALIDADELPRARGLAQLADVRGWPLDDLILAGGDDYELLFAMPHDRARKWLAGRARRGAPAITFIGECRPGRDGVTIVTDDGRRPLPAGGWRHFA